MDEEPDVVSDEIRYQPKAVDDSEWIASFLADQPNGVLGLVGDGEPYLVTQLFVYDPDSHSLFFHGALAGRTRRIVDADGRTDAAFTVSEMGRFIPHEVPKEFTVEYASVDVFGHITLVEDPDEKRRVLELFMAEFAPHLEPDVDYAQIDRSNVEVTSVYRFDIDAWSAKRGEKPPDHPGAYELDAVRERSEE